MSTTIDQRVVEMQFNNKQFENNVHTSMSTIDKLKQSLNLTGAAKGLDNVNAAANNCNMSGLNSAVQTIQAKFSALEVMAVTALANITNSAINAGKKIVSALTLDPIKTGFQEYETQINAVQTILANTSSKGTTINQVNAALDELNAYADKTIYNFTEMTRNIGTFTAAGVDLKTSVEAIKGIANLAAVSGSNAQQASTAMYQLSQALSSGTVKLMDWNSVVNAGMGGQVFQDSLKETARVHGIAIDDMITSEGSFRETLTDGWLSSEILTETLAKFTGDLTEAQLESMGYTKEQIVDIIKLGEMANDSATKVKTFTQMMDTLKEAAQSGWSQSWKIIIGDFEEAKALWSEVSDTLSKIIGDSADARNEILSGGLSSGWDQFLRKGIADEAGYIDSIKEVAKEHNIVVDDLIKDGESFESSLKQGWLTSNIMSESLEKLTAKTSGLSDEELETLGYTRKMVDELEALNESVQNGTISVEEFTKKMTITSGRENLITALRNSFNGLLDVIKPISEAFRDIFPPYTAEQLYALTEKIRDLTSNFKLSDETSDKLKRTFKGLFAVLDIIGQAFSAIFKAVSPLVGGISSLGDGVLGVTGTFGEWLVNLDKTIKKSDIFNDVLQNIVGVVKAVADAVGGFIHTVKEKFDFNGFDIFHDFLQRVHERMGQVLDAADGMKSGVSSAVDAMGFAVANSNFLQVLQTLWEGVKNIVGKIIDALGDFVSGAAEKLGNANFSGILDIINTVAAGGISLAISKFLKGLTEPLHGLQGILDGVVGILDGVKDCFKAYQTQLKADALMKIAGAIAVLAGAILVLSLIDSGKLAVSLGGIATLFGELLVSMAIFEKFSGNSKGIVKSCAAMVSISVAVLILSAALKSLSELNPAQLITGLVGVGVLMAEIALFLNTAKFSKKAMSTATGMVILASAIKILASACKDFGEMPLGEIVKGLSAIGIILTGLAVFTKLTGNAKHIISTGIALTAIAAAMKIFASALRDFGTMHWDEIGKGLAGMAGSLLAVTVAVNFMPKNMVSIGVGLIAVSSALVILSEALKKMGDMKGDAIAKGLIVLGGSMAILAVGLNAMNGTLAGSAALLIAVAALTVLTPILSILGAMSWEAIAKGLVSIAGAFAILGIAGLVLTPIVPAILALGGAFALIGVGVLGVGAGLLAAGAGLSALAIGFTSIATAGIAGATAVVAALTVIVTGMASLIPMIIGKIGEGIIAFCRVISEGAPAIGAAIKAVVLTLVDVLVECVPAIANGALALISGVLAALAQYAPQIVDSLFKFLIGILESLANNIPALIEAAIKVIMSFFEGVVSALSGIDTGVLIKGIAGIGLLSAIMLALAAVATLIPGAMLGVLGMGVVISELALVLAAIGGLAQIPGLSWLIGEGGKLLQGIGTAIGSFVGGIVGGFMSGVSSQFPQIGSDLSAFMANIEPFIEGASKINASTLDGVKALGETILILTAANILDGLTSWFTGGSSMTKFGAELAEFGPYFNRYYESIKGIDGSVVESSANAARVLSQMADNLPNSGGVVGWFSGENSLSVFAEELTKFGPKLKAYADSIAGLDGAVVTNSAHAAMALSELANNLPNSGGMVSWFTGDNDMATFGESLVSFGRNFAIYSGYMTNVDAGIVSTTTSAANAIVALQKSLPKEGGWFSDDMTLSSFGSDMASFGYYFSSYYNSVSAIDVSQLSAVISQTDSLVSMAKGMTGLDVSGMSGFGAALTALGETGVSGFIEAFTNSYSRVSAAAATMLTNFISGANSKQSVLAASFTTLVNTALEAIRSKAASFTTEGDAVMTKFISGIKAKSLSVTSTIKSVIDSALNSIKSRYYEFTSAGHDIMERLIYGIKSQCYGLSDSIVSSLDSAVTSIRYMYSDFYNAGAYLVEGFADGISENSYAASARARAMAASAANAARRELDEHSPSKVFYGIGNYAGLAFVNALGDYKSKSYTAGAGMAESAKNGLSSAIAKVIDVISIDTVPTIRPVLDLSNVQNGAITLHRMMNDINGYAISGSVDVANRTLKSMNQTKSYDDPTALAIDGLKNMVKDLTKNPSKVFENTFNITGNNPRETADEISRIIQRQVERREASWA